MLTRTAMPSNTRYEPHIYEHANVLILLSQGSEYAFQLVFDSYKNRIYNLAGINSLEAWLLTVSKNLTINYLKKIAHEWGAKKNLIPANEQIENSADFKVRDAEFTVLFQKALDMLSTQQRSIYQLAREEGLTYDQIGKKLSISPLTVKTHMARALASIRLFLKKHGGLFLFCLYFFKCF